MDKYSIEQRTQVVKLFYQNQAMLWQQHYLSLWQCQLATTFPRLD